MKITRNEINQILNSIKPHAKSVLERIYNKATKEIGGNDNFKSIIDRSFNIIADLEIENINQLLDIYFEMVGDETTVESVAEYFKSCTNAIQHLTLMPRGSNKSLTTTVSCTINMSVRQAFAEKLAEYINVDITDITSCH